jgi:hypothetical protein
VAKKNVVFRPAVRASVVQNLCVPLCFRDFVAKVFRPCRRVSVVQIPSFVIKTIYFSLLLIKSTNDA